MTELQYQPANLENFDTNNHNSFLQQLTIYSISLKRDT